MSRSPSRAWLLLPAGFSLLAGLDAGLLLLEAPAPLDAAHLPEVARHELADGEVAHLFFESAREPVGRQ